MAQPDRSVPGESDNPSRSALELARRHTAMSGSLPQHVTNAKRTFPLIRDVDFNIDSSNI
jgi:hypothetical protein